MGVAHFGALGAEVEPVLVRDRAAADDPAAAQAIGEADLIYLSGGKPAYLMGVLAGTAVGRRIAAAHERGAVLAGCSAGAMVLAGQLFDFRLRLAPVAAALAARPRVRAGRLGRAALRRLARAVCRRSSSLQAPRGSVVLGIDEETAVVGRDGAWQVHGRSRVTVWRGRHRDRYRAGDTFRF